jgi:hypothetical protein
VRVPYSERERGPKPRVIDTIDERTWGGIVILIQNRIDDGSFGAGYPSQCRDGRGPDGCDGQSLGIALRAEVDIEWPPSVNRVPDDQLSIFDLLEFLFENVGAPIQKDWHSFFGHYHLSFDVPVGQHAFVETVNRLFARNGIAFEMTAEGQIKRLLPAHAAQLIESAVFHTGDAECDRLLEYARAAVTNPSSDRRRDGLEKLWDAFERMKTLEPGKDKRATAEAMLDRVATGPVFRNFIGVEAKSLTDAGNALRIRHSETTQEILQNADEVDYLYIRMFGLIRLLLRAAGRGD